MWNPQNMFILGAIICIIVITLSILTFAIVERILIHKERMAGTKDEKIYPPNNLPI